jgi:hypothetical protein
MMIKMQSSGVSQRKQMECKDVPNARTVSASHFLTQVSMGLLPIGGSAPLFPEQSAPHPRRIT